jgi:hypothetical protein
MVEGWNNGVKTKKKPNIPILQYSIIPRLIKSQKVEKA